MKALAFTLTLFVAPIVFSKTIMQCAENHITTYNGARVNIIESNNGQLRANLIFGTTVSGTMYNVQEEGNKAYWSAPRLDRT